MSLLTAIQSVKKFIPHATIENKNARNSLPSRDQVRLQSEKLQCLQKGLSPLISSNSQNQSLYSKQTLIPKYAKNDKPETDCSKGYIEKDKFSATEALNHYKTQSGCSIRIPFTSVDTSSIKPDDFKKIQQELKDPTPRKVSIDDRLAFSTSDDNKLVLGNITLRLQGDLEISKDKSWTFTGTLKSYDDVYDFNASTHRSVLGEVLTFFGSQQEGKPYDIQIRGAKTAEEQGNIGK